jgi:hypothetical protein
MKQQAAFQANFDKQEEAFRSSPGVDTSYLRDGGARNASDHWSDLIRGVETFQIVGILPQSDNVRRCIAECQRADWKADCDLTFITTEDSIL